MEWTLIPLALLAVCGGLLNLPEYLGHGLLNSFLSQPGSHDLALPHTTELLLQLVAATVAIAGMAAAWYRFGGRRRQLRVAESQQPAQGLHAFLLEGWRMDSFYDLLFVRPFTTLATVLWKRIDEGCIDNSLTNIANILASCGRWCGGLGHGRVSLSLVSMAAGAAVMIIWLAWVAV
jgi:NADH-quinone oxidoreductase subunit L